MSKVTTDEQRSLPTSLFDAPHGKLSFSMEEIMLGEPTCNVTLIQLIPLRSILRVLSMQVVPRACNLNGTLRASECLFPSRTFEGHRKV